MDEVFEVVPRRWRGLGAIAASGLALRESYRKHDAALLFPATRQANPVSATECIAGEVLRGVKTPDRCPAFGTRCTPEKPLGAPMVSGEGACAAYYRYGTRAVEDAPA
jgi:hydrogenase expression/formation protein HypD